MSSTPTDITDSEHEDVLPERLRVHLEGQFVIEEEVGRGGMATVWRARRKSDNAAVAIKVLRPALAEAVGSRRFLREIEIAGNTQSPFLVPLEASGQFGGLSYYVMPFIDGGSLRQRIVRDRELPIAEAVRIGRDIAAALAALHRDGIIHRDVKPENILLRNGREVMVADYGIARALTASTNEVITSTGVVVGTPAYMSPEHANGDPVDARSDQYAWGCVVYELLLGVPPFHGATSSAIIARHRHDPPPSLRTVRSTIPESLEAVVTKAMAKSPADRFASVDELLETLDRVDLGDLDSLSTVARRWRRAATVAGIGAVVGVAAWAAWRSAHPALDPNRVAFFPLVSLDSALNGEAARISAVVRSVLEDIEPDRFVDGAPRLEPAERSLPMDVTRSSAIARRFRARYVVGGTIRRTPGHPDSVQVAVTLRDLERGGDTTVVSRGTESTLRDVAVSVMVGLLPRLTGLERQINPASLVGRSPTAVSNWLRGEREYRSFRIHAALNHLRLAIAADSSLAPAAIRGAMAAMWANDEREASQLVAIAQRHGSMLSTRQAAFAQALRLYLSGRADSTVMAVRNVLAADSTWAEPWMLLGEAFLHLQPAVPLDTQLLRAVPPPVTWPLESWAQDAFRRSRLVDPGFLAPVAHLAEAAARHGDVRGLDTLLTRLRAAGSDSAPVAFLALARRCLTSAPTPADWVATARSQSGAVLEMGIVLSGATSSRARACADGAWAGLQQVASAPNEAFAALVARFGSFAAAAAPGAALALVDSAVAGGNNAALGLYVVGAAAGIDPGTRVDAFIAQLDAAIESRPAPSLWLLALWSARSADTIRLSRVRARLETLLAANGSRLDKLMTGVVDAYQSLARGDTATALRAFAALSPSAPTTVLQGSLWESLAAERLTYARLLLATGAPAAAHRVASVFDQPGLYVNALFLRPSLEVRAQAARALGDQVLWRAADERLRQLSSVPR
jgi:hypothetical protein